MKLEAYKVLIADDSEDDRFFLRRLLDRYPRFRIIGEACDGEQAINYFSRTDTSPLHGAEVLPDLLFLDLHMPRKDGFDVLRWLRTQDYATLSVVVLSSSALIEDHRQSLTLGADRYWMKTAEQAAQDRMMASIEAMLDERRSDKRATWKMVGNKQGNLETETPEPSDAVLRSFR